MVTLPNDAQHNLFLLADVGKKKKLTLRCDTRRLKASFKKQTELRLKESEVLTNNTFHQKDDVATAQTIKM